MNNNLNIFLEYTKDLILFERCMDLCDYNYNFDVLDNDSMEIIAEALNNMKRSFFVGNRWMEFARQCHGAARICYIAAKSSSGAYIVAKYANKCHKTPWLLCEYYAAKLAIPDTDTITTFAKIMSINSNDFL